MVLTKKQASPPIKIFNRYQKVMLVWAVLVLIGYLASSFYMGAPNMLVSIWLLVLLIGLSVQLILGYPKKSKTVIAQIVWFGIILIGSYLTFLEYSSGTVIGIHGMLSGWFFLVALGMLITSAIYRFNISYLILFALYAVVGLILAYSGLKINIEIIISGFVFFILFLVDIGMEWSIWRRHIADKPK